MILGRLREEGSKYKPDEGGAFGCLGAGGGPRACGWVTLYNYNTVVKASEPRWWRVGDAGFPSAQPFSALNGLVLFGLELTVVCFSNHPHLPHLFSLPGLSACSRSSESPSLGGRIVKWPLSKQERESLEFAFFWAPVETRMCVCGGGRWDVKALAT